MKKQQVTIGLINPKSPSNVGSVMRAAGCYRVDAVCYTGNRYARAARLNTDTKGVQNKIPLARVDDLLGGLAGVTELAPNTKVVCVELVEGAMPLPEYQHPDNALYIFGPEDGSIDQAIIDGADAVVYVPTVGCMNLAGSVNVLLYDRLAKSVDTTAGDDLIRSSRDTNNRLQVKR
ncbi:MAG: RNA methyltransferase [Thiotrichaceae bacterium]|nr:RNA methyltransferase [Thiotrichaceae bacterium]PCI12760.1 MAG: 23S rRNA methyltransferase [Thiotrichales bacterium]